MESILKDYRVFFVDVETNTMKGIPQFSSQAKIIQLCVQDYESGATFVHLGNPIDEDDEGKYVAIPPESSAIHRITIYDIKKNQAIQSADLVKHFRDWVEKFAKKGFEDVEIDLTKRPEERERTRRKPLLVAHNARFDKNMILKCLEGVAVGPDGKNLDWSFFCTLKAFRELYPDLSDIYSPAERPYSLGMLTKHFFPDSNLNQAHNARADIAALKDLFEKLIVPKIQGDPLKYSIDQPRTPRTMYIRDINGVGGTRLKKIVQFINSNLTTKQTKKFRTNEELAMVGHLVMVGKKLVRQKAKTLFNSNGEDDWVLLKELEKALRTTINIHQDETLVNILAAVAGIQPLELVTKTAYANGNPNVFPGSPGTVGTYLPFKFNPEEAKRIWLQLKIASATQLYTDYTFTVNKESFRLQIQGIMSKGRKMTPDTFNTAINTLLMNYDKLKKPSKKKQRKK